MSNYQNQAYPPPATAYVTEPTGGYTAPPPPVGYPARDEQVVPQSQATKPTTQSRGDGFWKGCCAALCCCCVLDACF